MSAQMFRLFLSGIALTLILAGCGSDEPEDVREWMRTNSANLKGKIPDLPQIKPLPAVVYEPGDLASPFVPEKLIGAEQKSLANSTSRMRDQMANNPDAYPLTRVPLENIRMIGTLSIGKNVVGVVATDRDAPRQVKIGDYIGQNHGRISAIHEASDSGDGEIEVIESVLDKGSWVERTNRITQQTTGGSSK